MEMDQPVAPSPPDPGFGFDFGLSPAQWCQAFFSLSVVTLVVVAAVPPKVGSLLTAYGPRQKRAAGAGVGVDMGEGEGEGTSEKERERKREREGSKVDYKDGVGDGGGVDAAPAPTPFTETTTTTATRPSPQQQQQPGRAMALFAAVMRSTQVPHAWFGSFYAISLLLSAFWAAEYAFLCGSPARTEGGRESGGGGSGSNSCVLRRLAAAQVAADGGISGGDSSGSSRTTTASSPPSGMTMGQVKLLWACMMLQAARRGLEQATLAKSSKSNMWVGHWLLGLGFYVSMSIAVWIEGAGAILASLRSEADATALGHTSRSDNIDDGAGLPFITLAMIPVILYAWYGQNWCHRHLASLKKYSVPSKGRFRDLICPHYTFECLLYAAMAAAATPSRGPKAWNITMLWALFFVVGNLSMTARGTRRWYVERFGEQAVRGKWIMFPFIF